MAPLATHRRLPAAAFAATVLLGAWYAGYMFLGLGPGDDHLVYDWVYAGVSAAACVVCLLRVAVRTDERLPWLLVAAAMAASTVGNVYSATVLWNADPYPATSVADAAWLLSYPLDYIALVLLLKRTVRSLRATMWTDGVIAGLALGAVAAAAVFAWTPTDGGSALATLVLTAYPLSDVGTLAVAAAIVAASAWRLDRALLALVGAFALNAGADVVYAYQVAAGTYTIGTPLDLAWVLSPILIASAALAPRVARRTAALDGWRVLVSPAIFGALAVGLVFADHFRRVHDVALLLAAAALAAVLVRLCATIGENLRMLAHARREADLDALTGLANRRKLLADLPQRLAEAHDDDALALVVFDLNGFKPYNDRFGHVAGDVLLERLGGRLAAAVAGVGVAYRMGGDEFCAILAPADGDVDRAVRGAAAALVDPASGVSAAHGVARVPAETREAIEALRLADGRMYAAKAALGRRAA